MPTWSEPEMIISFDLIVTKHFTGTLSSYWIIYWGEWALDLEFFLGLVFFTAGQGVSKGKNIRKQCDPTRLASAFDAARRGEIGYVETSKLYGVPQRTSERLAEKQNIAPALAVQIPLGRRSPLRQDNEESLTQFIVFMEQWRFGSQLYRFLNLPSKSPK